MTRTIEIDTGNFTRLLVTGMPDKDLLLKFFNQKSEDKPLELIQCVFNGLCSNSEEGRQINYGRYSHTLLLIRHMMFTVRMNLSKSIFKADTEASKWNFPIMDFTPRLTHVCFCCTAENNESILEKFTKFIIRSQTANLETSLLSSARFHGSDAEVNTMALGCGIHIHKIQVSSVSILFVHLLDNQ